MKRGAEYVLMTLSVSCVEVMTPDGRYEGNLYLMYGVATVLWSRSIETDPLFAL